MAIASKNLLVWVKAMSRGQDLPLDASEIWESKEAAEAYARGLLDKSTVAYAGQRITVVTENDVSSYIIAKDGSLIKQAAEGDITRIESKFFIGTQEEYETANANNEVAAGAIVIITDDEILAVSTTSKLGQAVLGQMILG